MKHIMFFSIMISSLSLNAMDAPNVTKWRQICENPEKDEQLKMVYKDFCTKRYYSAVPWTIASCVPFGGWFAAVLKKPSYRQIHPNKMIAFGSLAFLFAYYKIDSLGEYGRRKHWADRGNLYHLNDDVLRQLGNPRVVDGGVYAYTQDRMGFFEQFALNNVKGIEKALSGNHTASEIGIDELRCIQLS